MNPPHKKRKSRFTALTFTRRSAAIVVALLMVAAPASASIIVQNFMEAELAVSPPCFVKVAGADAGSGLADFDLTNRTPVDGVNLLEEKVDLTAMRGDRVIYTDMVEYQNNCTEPIDVVLTSTTVGGAWDDVAAEIWISNVAAPANVDPNLDVVADDWNDTQIIVPAGTAAGSYVQSTGVITLAPNETVKGAFVISVDEDYVAGANPVVNWVAQATIS